MQGDLVKFTFFFPLKHMCGEARKTRGLKILEEDFLHYVYFFLKNKNSLHMLPWDMRKGECLP